MVVILRPPIAAGTFYDINPDNLRKQLSSYFASVTTRNRKSDTVAAIVPHSVYIYSGKVMAQSYANIGKSNFVILGSNHSGRGANFALMKNSLWKTPLGEIAVDDDFANKLLKECNLVEFDAIPHENEFSIEVQLPFLLYKFGDLKILPITVNNQVPDEILLENCKIVGKSIAKLSKKSKWKIIASSDLSQNIQKESTEKTDKQIIRTILKLDPKEFFDKIRMSNAQVCGYGSIATAMYAAKELGAKKAEVLGYGTSADLGEEDKSVIGYASIIFY